MTGLALFLSDPRCLADGLVLLPNFTVSARLLRP